MYYKVDGYVFAEVIREISYSEQSRYQASGILKGNVWCLFLCCMRRKKMLAADSSDVPFLHIGGLQEGNRNK